MKRHHDAATLLGVILCAAAFASAALGNDYQIYVLGVAATGALVGVGLNIMLGLTGQLSLGHAGFLALGAYIPTLIATRLEIGYGTASLIGMVLTGLVGIALSIPALRVRGPYLAMITIAFGFVVEQGIADWKDLTGGWNGLSGIGRPAPFGEPLSSRALTLLEVALAFAAVPAFGWLRNSRLGLLMRATRNSEVAARSIGVDLVLVRALAFGLSAAVTGLAGALFASSTSFISPESFPFFLSITFVLIVLVGGEGHALGPILGSAIVILLPELLSGLAEYRLLFFGVLLFIVLRLLPHGLAGLLLRWRAPAPTSEPTKTDAHRSGAARMVADWIGSGAGATLHCSDLAKRFGGNTALEQVSISVLPGQITALIGPNGAGKTTFINLACGFYSADRGAITLGGQTLTGMAMHERARAGVVRTFQTTQLFDELSVSENVCAGLTRGRMMAGSLRSPDAPADAQALAAALLQEVGYTGPLQVPASSLPHVDRRLVELARALAMQPQVLLLDEPAAGLSRLEKDLFVSVLRRIAGHGIGVFLIEHDMGVVLSASSIVHVLDGGRPLAQGPCAQIAEDPRVRQAYLGDGTAFARVRRDAPSGGDGPSAKVWLGVEHLDAGYGKLPVLHEVDLRLTVGSVTAILGPNGAGKSTLMKALSGLVGPTGGRIVFRDEAVTPLPAFERARRGLVLVPEGRQVFSEMSVEDNLRLGATVQGGLADAHLQSLLAEFPRLIPLRQRPAGLLSGGEQQMLALARGLAAQPSMLLLDEPTLGLAPAIARELFESLAVLASRGLTLLVADQMAHLAVPLSDDVHVMSQGRITTRLRSAELTDLTQLERAYFDRA
jgi:ABC-type branched-subunit amino acid transport system ATPase component/ABC-type branched-subunit amino acid transport system permease subunit